MLPLGAPAPSDPNAQYRTRCFLEFTVRGVDVDVMAGFVILENGQEHDCALKPEQVAEHILVRGEDIPLQSLEDWRRYYAWMGRTSKVAMIDGKQCGESGAAAPSGSAPDGAALRRTPDRAQRGCKSGPGIVQ